MTASNRSLRRTVLSFFLLVASTQAIQSQDNRSVSPTVALDSVLVRVFQNRADLLSLAKAHTGSNPEAEITTSLVCVSELFGAHVSTSTDLIFLVEMVSDPGSRSRVRPYVLRRIAALKKDLEGLVERVNSSLGYLKGPAVVASGRDLRELLRRTVAQLDTAALNRALPR